MGSLHFWRKYLIIASYIFIAFGIILAYLNHTEIFFFDKYINPVFWSSEIINESTKNFQRFTYGLIGTSVSLWGVFLFFISKYAFKTENVWAWRAITYSFLLWLVMDNSISIYFGVWFNVIFNLLFVLVMGLPIIFSRNYFEGDSKGI